MYSLDSQSNVSETGIKSAKSGTSASSNRAQQKTGKSSQTSKGTKHQECIVCKKVMPFCQFLLILMFKKFDS